MKIFEKWKKLNAKVIVNRGSYSEEKGLDKVGGRC
jgi:hypothetical protein